MQKQQLEQDQINSLAALCHWYLCHWIAIGVDRVWPTYVEFKLTFEG